MLAPPWIPVPPPGYGGIEQVLALLAAELTERGNHVTLFAAPGTRSRARVLSPLEGPHPDQIEMSLYEADHVASAFARMEQSDPPFDVLHDHCGFTAFAFADRISTPVVHAARPLQAGHVGVLRTARPQGRRRRPEPLSGRAGAQ